MVDSSIQIAILTAIVGVLVALIGGWIELRKSRQSQQTVENQVSPNGGASLRDAVNRIALRVETLDNKFDVHVERLARLEERAQVRRDNEQRRRWER